MSELLETMDTLELFIRNRVKGNRELNEYDLLLLEDTSKALDAAAKRIKELEGFFGFLFEDGTRDSYLDPEGKSECTWPNGMIVRPNGVDEMLPHVMRDVEIHRNVTVTISKCKHCDYVDIAWERQEDTEDEYLNEEEEDCDEGQA